MSYKIDTVITMLDEILMRLHRIERQLEQTDEFFEENAPRSVDQEFDSVFGTKNKKPVLRIVKPEEPTNIIEFDKYE
jgi:hypothetical protein